jgi:hypothetical protein
MLVHNTSLTPPHFIEFHVLIQERERSYTLVRGIHFACVSNYFSVGYWKCSNSGVIFLFFFYFIYHYLYIDKIQKFSTVYLLTIMTLSLIRHDCVYVINI